jgi:hypothetical protein
VIFTCGFATVRSAWRGMMSGCIYCYYAMRPDSTLKSTLESLSMPFLALPRIKSRWLWKASLLSPDSSFIGAHDRNTTRTPIYITFDDCPRRRILLSNHQTRLKHEAAVLRQLDLTHSERALSVRFLRSHQSDISAPPTRHHHHDRPTTSQLASALRAAPTTPLPPA